MTSPNIFAKVLCSRSHFSSFPGLPVARIFLIYLRVVFCGAVFLCPCTRLIYEALPRKFVGSRVRVYVGVMYAERRRYRTKGETAWLIMRAMNGKWAEGLCTYSSRSGMRRFAETSHLPTSLSIASILTIEALNAILYSFVFHLNDFFSCLTIITFLCSFRIRRVNVPDFFFNHDNLIIPLLLMSTSACLAKYQIDLAHLFI